MEIIKKNWKFFTTVIVTIIAFLLLSIYSLKVSEGLYYESDKIEAEKTIEGIQEGTVVSQIIESKGNNLEKIKIKFDPLKEENSVGGNVKITLKTEAGNIIKEETIARNHIRENNVYEFKFKKQKESEGKKYKLDFYFENLDEKSKFFTINYTENKIEGKTLLVDGKEITGTLDTQEFYKSNKKMAIYVAVAIALSLYILCMATKIYFTKNMKIENIFLATVPIICVAYLITMPTFKNHDELYHWYRSYEVSKGILATDISGESLGTMLPDSIAKVSTYNWETIDYKAVQENINVPLDEENQRRIYSETSAVYSFVQYIPQGIGIFLARIFTDKVLLLAYAGRLFNLLVSVLCIYFAIKLIPFGKRMILLVSYIPIAIEGFSSMSPDAMTISVAFLYVSYILNLAFGKKEFIGNKERIILTVSSVVMALCKIVYLPLVLLLFIIPKEKFKKKTNKSKILNLAIIAMIAIIINLIWLGISSQYLAHFREGDSKIQVLSILANPIQYVQIALYTLDLNGAKYIYSLFGGELGWGEFIKVNSIVPYTLFILTIFLTIIDSSIKGKFENYQKWVIVLVILAICALIFTSLYVQWTTCGSESILGIQGRYFIPILPIAMILIGSVLKVKSEYKEHKLNQLVGILGILLQLPVVLQIVITHL